MDERIQYTAQQFTQIRLETYLGKIVCRESSSSSTYGICLLSSSAQPMRIYYSLEEAFDELVCLSKHAHYKPIKSLS